MAKTGKGGSSAPKPGAKSGNAGWPSKTGKPSGGGRTTNPPATKK